MVATANSQFLRQQAANFGGANNGNGGNSVYDPQRDPHFVGYDTNHKPIFVNNGGVVRKGPPQVYPTTLEDYNATSTTKGKPFNTSQIRQSREAGYYEHAGKWKCAACTQTHFDWMVGYCIHCQVQRKLDQHDTLVGDDHTFNHPALKTKHIHIADLSRIGDAWTVISKTTKEMKDKKQEQALKKSEKQRTKGKGKGQKSNDDTTTEHNKYDN